MVDFGALPEWSHPSDFAAQTHAQQKPFVRYVQTHDLRELAKLLTQCFHPAEGLFACFHPLLAMGVYEDLRIRQHLPASQYRCLIASYFSPLNSKNEIIGTIEIGLRPIFWGGSPRPYISNLAVKPSFRRQGIARQLLIKCEQVVWEWGTGELTLHVMEDNLAAKQLYLSSGYQIKKSENSVQSILFQQPRRLFLQKSLS